MYNIENSVLLDPERSEGRVTMARIVARQPTSEHHRKTPVELPQTPEKPHKTRRKSLKTPAKLQETSQNIHESLTNLAKSSRNLIKPLKVTSRNFH